MDHIAIAAVRRGFDADTVRAIVEVESGPDGAFGDHGRPIIKYEPHVAWRVATPMHQRLLRDAGVAYPKWGERPYPKSQAARWARFDLCADVAGRDVAIQACSWGLGQVLGENWRMCGFASPADFERAQATEAGQIETMLRFLEGADLTGAINARDWRRIARRYNGPGQVDAYAALMEAAYRRIAGQASPVVLRIGDTGAAVRQWQRIIGEREDGQFGPRTAALTEAFQRDNGLVVDGMVGAMTWARAHEVGATSKAPPAQPVPTPAADWTATASKIGAGAAAVTAAVKGVSEATTVTAQAAAGIDPLWIIAALGAAGALYVGARIAKRERAS